MTGRIALFLVAMAVIASIVVQVLDPLPVDTPPPIEPPTGRSTMLGVSPGSGIIHGDADELAADLNVMVELGAGWIRLDIDWSRVEPDQGRWDWEATDRLIDAAHDRGFRILGLLTYTPPWARPSGTSDKHPPTDPSDFADFAAAAADRYRNVVDGWEIWNEPNSQLFWATGPDPVAYAGVLSASAQRIRLIDPTAVILSGGLAPASDTVGVEMSPETFLDQLLRTIEPGAIDAVAIHPYSFPADPSDGSLDWNLFARLPDLHDQVARTVGRPIPLWLTEFGAPHESDQPERQAEIILEGLSCAAQWTWAGPVFVYSLNDAADDPGDRAFGIVGPSGERRPAWSAVRRFASLPWAPSHSTCPGLDP